MKLQSLLSQQPVVAALNAKDSLQWHQDGIGGFVTNLGDGSGYARTFPNGKTWTWQIVRNNEVEQATEAETDEAAREEVQAYLSGGLSPAQPVLVAGANVFGLDGNPFANNNGIAEPGAPFVIRVLLPEGIPTGDNREFEYGSTELAPLPYALLWQIATDAGHDSSVIIGRIDTIERLQADPENGIPEGWGNARGVFDNGPYGREAQRLVANKMLYGVSADLDMFEGDQNHPDDDEDFGILDKIIGGKQESTEDKTTKRTKKIKSEPIRITHGRIRAATLVAKPAFIECIIELLNNALPGPEVVEELPTMTMLDGIYEEATDDQETITAALVAAAAPVVPPRTWFDNPRLSGPTPITVDENGRVFGHIAAWNVSHIGLPGNTRPPRSRSGYQYFRTGVLRTDDGADMPVGQLTLAGGHAPLHASAADAVKHYDDTSSAIADVTAGEDQFGIWVAGALRPEATPEQVRALRASAPSGDWRPINGRLELVAVCQVNVPGFPVARAMVAGGHITALVAAGARPLAEMREEKTRELEARLFALEAAENQRKRDAITAQMSAMVAAADAESTIKTAAARESALDVLRNFSA